MRKLAVYGVAKSQRIARPPFQKKYLNSRVCANRGTFGLWPAIRQGLHAPGLARAHNGFGGVLGVSVILRLNSRSTGHDVPEIVVPLPCIPTAKHCI